MVHCSEGKFKAQLKKADASLARVALVIGDEEVASDAIGDFVFVVKGDRAERRSVTTGASVGSKVKVSSGVVTGERVVLALSEELQASLRTGQPLVVSD